jgi:hypothetical protein
MDVEVLKPWLVAVAMGKLDLELQLGRCYREVAHRARVTVAKPAPPVIGASMRKLPRLQNFADLGAHHVVFHRAGSTGAPQGGVQDLRGREAKPDATSAHSGR